MLSYKKQLPRCLYSFCRRGWYRKKRVQWRKLDLSMSRRRRRKMWSKMQWEWRPCSTQRTGSVAIVTTPAPPTIVMTVAAHCVTSVTDRTHEWARGCEGVLAPLTPRPTGSRPYSGRNKFFHFFSCGSRKLAQIGVGDSFGSMRFFTSFFSFVDFQHHRRNHRRNHCRKSTNEKNLVSPFFSKKWQKCIDLRLLQVGENGKIGLTSSQNSF